MQESATLKMGRKKISGSPPFPGTQSGHVVLIIGKYSMSTTLPKPNVPYPSPKGTAEATWV